jgi:CO/xanthine dehydrogenase FAD-binding subunit
VLGVAATLELNADGKCAAATTVLTAVASVPVYVDMNSILRGQTITPELIETAAESAARVSHPVDNTDMDYWYRKRMAKVYVKRALTRLAGLEKESH